MNISPFAGLGPLPPAPSGVCGIACWPAGRGSGSGLPPPPTPSSRRQTDKRQQRRGGTEYGFCMSPRKPARGAGLREGASGGATGQCADPGLVSQCPEHPGPCDGRARGGVSPPHSVATPLSYSRAQACVCVRAVSSTSAGPGPTLAWRIHRSQAARRKGGPSTEPAHPFVPGAGPPKRRQGTAYTPGPSSTVSSSPHLSDERRTRPDARLAHPPFPGPPGGMSRSGLPALMPGAGPPKHPLPPFWARALPPLSFLP